MTSIQEALQHGKYNHHHRYNGHFPGEPTGSLQPSQRSWEQLIWYFCRPDAVPVTQPKGGNSKH